MTTPGSDPATYINEVYDPAKGPNGLRHMAETTRPVREQSTDTAGEPGELTADALAAMTPEQRETAYDQAFSQLNIARDHGDRPASPFWAGTAASNS